MSRWTRFRLWLAGLILPKRYHFTFDSVLGPANKHLRQQVEILWRERLEARDPRLAAARVLTHDTTLRMPIPEDPVFEQAENV